MLWLIYGVPIIPGSPVYFVTGAFVVFDVEYFVESLVIVSVGLEATDLVEGVVFTAGLVGGFVTEGLVGIGVIGFVGCLVVVTFLGDTEVLCCVPGVMFHTGHSIFKIKSTRNICLLNQYKMAYLLALPKQGCRFRHRVIFSVWVSS